MIVNTWSWAWSWWSIIVAVNVFNLIVGVVLFVKSRRKYRADKSSYKRNMRVAGIIFIVVALYRSIFVSNYLNQLAWFNTLLNSTLLIRSFALFAELSFAYLIMRLLLQGNNDLKINDSHNSKLLFFLKSKVPLIFFSFIAIANLFAFGGSITKVHLLFAIEETLWGLGFLLITPLVLIQKKRVISGHDITLKQYAAPLVFLAVFCVGYTLYSVFYHLPIEYWPEAINQLTMENPDPAFQFGFKAIVDSFKIINVTHDYATWGGLGFVIWHSGYFTLCGWMVLFFMNGPRKKAYNDF
jgi:hypothetical protein